MEEVMKEISWTGKQGNEIKIIYLATARVVKEEIKADGQDTGVVKEWLYEDTESRVYLDGVDLGPAEFKAVRHDVIHCVLCEKVALTKERYDEIKAIEKAAKEEARDADEEVKRYLDKKEKEINKAIEEVKRYTDHNKSVQDAMNLGGDTY
jgi:hypothetical protein